MCQNTLIVLFSVSIICQENEASVYLKTYQQRDALLLLDGEPVEALGVVHHAVVLPVHVEDQHDVILFGPVGQEPEHGHPGVTGPLLSEIVTKGKCHTFLTCFLTQLEISRFN